MQRPATRARPSQPSDNDVPFKSQLYPNSIPLYEWQRKWRPVLIQHVETNSKGGFNGLYCASDAFAERPYDPNVTNSAGGPRSTHHVTCGYSTRLAERLSMEYSRLWPQRGRIRVHWILPLPGSFTQDQCRRIEERIHMMCAIHAQEERLRTTEFYMPEALPLIWECFKSVERHLSDKGFGMPYKLTAALPSGEYCWVYAKPTVSHPPVDIFAKPFGQDRERWLAYRRNEMNIMAPFRVRGQAVIEAESGPITRSRSLIDQPGLGAKGKPLYEPFKSRAKHKKYSVWVKDKNGGRKLLHFGDTRYQQYRDVIGAFSNLDHGDKQRRDRYYQRHGEAVSKDSAKWWSHRILWPLD